MRAAPAAPVLGRALAALLLVAALLAAWAPSARAQADASWYAERISTGDAPVRVEHYWSKGPWLRSETVFAGHPIVTLVKGERYMIIDRLNGEGISIQRSPRAIAQDPKRGRPFGNELAALMEEGGEKVGPERIPGGTCDLYRLTDETGRREVCVSQDELQIPVLLRVWMRRTGRSMESRYLGWSRKITIPDAFFEPPPGTRLEPIGYQDYVERAPKEQLGPAPPLHADLLHGP